MRKYILAMLGMTAAVAVVSAAAAAEKTVNLTRGAISGMNTTIAYAGRWDKDCKTVPVTVTITRQPANGTVSVIDADEALPASTPGSGSTGQCADKVIKSKMIMYQSKKDFRGNDTLSYDSDGNGTLVHTTITLTVQ